MKVKIAVILTALIMASGRYIPAYADGGGQPPYIEPSAETTIPEPSVPETAYPSEPTVDPYEEMYQQQSEANANTHSLLTDIKDMIGGIMSFSSNETPKPFKWNSQFSSLRPLLLRHLSLHQFHG